MADHSITKLDAARLQIEAAIFLYFADASFVPIHTLAAAAHELLRNLDDARTESYDFVTERAISILDEELGRAVYRKIVRAPANFFKHADRDPDGVLPLDPDLTELLLLEAAQAYQSFDNRSSLRIDAYEVWLQLARPDSFEYPEDPTEQLDAWRNLMGEGDKTEFFARFCQLSENLE